MKKNRNYIHSILALSFVLAAAVAVMISCGGNTTSSNATTGTVQTTLSDPPTARCKATYANVWVTITKVEANLSADAGPNDSGWQTLVDLSTPQQVDLLTLNPAADPNFCGTLYMLAKQQLPPGNYRQIRLFLLANNSQTGPSTNNCGSGNGWNCVVPKDAQGNALDPIELSLPSEAQTGIKIPASQIDGGGLTVTAAQNTDLNIDINTCASIVKAGNSGKYLLKPVLHAGEVSLNHSVISGKVVEANDSTSPTPGAPVADAIVLLEQTTPDPTINKTVDRVLMMGSTGSDGTFSFCPLAATSTNVDIVVAGQTSESGTITYNPTVLFDVPLGADVGNIPIYAETAGSGTPLDPATISGLITTAGSSGAVTGTVEISPLQDVTNSSSTVSLTIPVFGAMAEPPNFTTESGSCPSGTPTGVDCATYSMPVPASSPAMATYSTSSFTYTPPSNQGQADYTVNAVPSSSSGCSPASAISDSFTVMPGDTASSITTPTPTTTVPSLEFDFTGCSGN